MDAKSNTHICPSPVPQTETESKTPAPPSSYMIVVSGGIPGTMLRLNETGTSLGRSPDSSFQLFDITVSRQHALISIDGQGAIHLTDQKSTNGTFVNNKRIAPHRSIRLEDGDRVQLGTNVVLEAGAARPQR